MSDKKTKIIICVAVGVLIVVLGVAFSIVTMMNNDKKDMQKRQEDVKEKYQAFKEEADKFTDARKEYQTKVVENMYVESVVEEYEQWIEALKEYQEVVDKVLSHAKEVGDVCIDKTYPDQDVMSHCKAYMINNETVMNYFVKDVEAFNEFLEEYYKDYQGDKEKYPTYELADTYHYIDVNDDGNYIGKE